MYAAHRSLPHGGKSCGLGIDLRQEPLRYTTYLSRTTGADQVNIQPYDCFESTTLRLKLIMLSSTRSRLASLAARTTSPSLLRPLSTTPFRSNSGPGTGENRIPANDPTPREPKPNVSATNETAIDAMGAQDKPLQESQADAERQRQLQAPNRAGIWSRSQQERSVAMSGPRFEQTIMETQVGLRSIVNGFGLTQL